MTEQELFDRVATHLLTQNRKSINRLGNCAYRINLGRSTLMCAVGCLISEDRYDKRMEGVGVGALQFVGKTNELRVDPDTEALDEVQENALNLLVQRLQEVGAGEHIELLKQLQSIHDGTHVNLWRSDLEGLARARNLIMPEVPNGG